MLADAPLTAEPALTFGTISVRLLFVLLLVLLNAFFVAAEFALVAVRRSRIDQMAADGDGKAMVVQRALAQLDRYISGTQLGITLASLALGWIGEPAVAVLVDKALRLVGITPAPGAVHTGAGIAVAFLVITFLHIVLGELAPKSIALAKPESVSRWVARPLMLFSKAMSPFISFLNGTANRMLALVGIEPASEGGHVHSPEELRLLVMQARAHGTLDESDSAMLAGVFDFHNKRALDVMRPRTDMVAIAEDVDRDELAEILRRERYSRYPVYRDTADDIVGVFLAKDFWLAEHPETFELRAVLREPLFVPATRAAERVLDDLRRTRAHLAVVLDEYGGTAGIVTMEDLVEEVIGDIADEYDPLSRDALLFDGVLELAGSMSLVDVRSDHKLPIPDGDWSTLGGYAFAALGRLPRVGDRVTYPGGELEVVAMDGRRVAALRVHRRADIEEVRT
ncbi:MAG: hemolysin family protein [Gemmatimonas sp.]|jgi:CBS domain containing-hemolysin-like protein|uniref:hemolysin family protein n=1 Tax=Gemmatimonas sp. TaxID=1962908 RepID=UPI00391F0416|nr:hemolysin family protein [Gemmatimonadota bacterium]